MLLKFQPNPSILFSPLCVEVQTEIKNDQFEVTLAVSLLFFCKYLPLFNLATFNSEPGCNSYLQGSNLAAANLAAKRENKLNKLHLHFYKLNSKSRKSHFVHKSE